MVLRLGSRQFIMALYGIPGGQLAERTEVLENMYNELGMIAHKLGCESYSHKSQNWLPHIKIVELPEN